MLDGVIRFGFEFGFGSRIRKDSDAEKFRFVLPLECTAAHWGRVWDPGFSDKKCKDLCPRDKPNEKIDVHDCPDILAILS